MSEINQPKEIVPDDDQSYIAPELAMAYDFDGELYEEEMSEHDESEALIVAGYDNYINIQEIEEYALSDSSTPGSTYLPPQILRLVDAEYSRGSDGTTYVNFEFEVEKINGAAQYEIRVLEMD